MAKASLTISSKNYSSWSLCGWLLTRFYGLPFDERLLPPDDPHARAEILLLSSSTLVPCQTHNGIKVWDTLAIAECLNEMRPKTALLPAGRTEHSHCRSICGEMHSGFASLRASLPMNIKAHFPDFKIWACAQSDIDRICDIWRNCLLASRFTAYEVKLDADCQAYASLIMAIPEMRQWARDARLEPNEIDELEMKF